MLALMNTYVCKFKPQKTGVSVLCGLINLIPAMQKILDHDISLYE